MNDRDRFTGALQKAADPIDVKLSEAAIERMWTYYTRMVQANRDVNLTRITEPAAAAVKLFADSLSPSCWAQSSGETIKTVLDIGSGAGFPAVPLAVARPSWRVTAIDSTAKKIRFVQNALTEIEIFNLKARHARAEQWGGSSRFDLVTLKAVGPLSRCVAFAQRHVARNGIVAVFKSTRISRQEVDAGQRAAENVGLTVWDVFEYDLPLEGDTISSALFIFRRIG